MKNVVFLFIFLFLSGLVAGGVIEVITIPENASVYVNGEYYNQSPCNIKIREEWAWIHKFLIIQINKEGYLPQNKSVFIPTMEYYSKIVFSLVSLNGTLNVDSAPSGAFVKVIGEGKTFNGTTPFEISLKPGNYTVTVTLKDYLPNSTRVEILPNKTEYLQMKLKPIPGRLFVNSTPSNLTAVVTGSSLIKNCTTPCKLVLPPGSYTVNVTDGKGWNSTILVIKPNSTVSVSLRVPVKKAGISWALPLAIGLLIIAAGGAYVYSSGWLRGKGKVDVRINDRSVEIKAGSAFGISHVGARKNNEDSLLILKLPDAYLLAVADGLGGHNAGEVASQIAVDTLKEVFEQEYKKEMGEEEVKALLRKAHELAHNRIKESAVGERRGMGTTLVTAFVRDGEVIIANTGDSRAYLIRNGKIVRRTKDHSLVQELIDKGEITEEEARRHPMRNIITKALGIDFGIDFYEWGLENGDILLLSSDGLHDYVDDSRIAEIASQGKNVEDIAKKLIEEALPVTRDNVTVVVWKY
ncbi:Stp1/IreP family PP2C-type Ser/Thr phosphatase [Thermococcus barophilus]|uniref:Protein serine/threonine phosphatase (Modular protein) n=1 Tax=Thermococcus barophilus TaxID=55802 RepID=A0A0S1XCN0_THEBA|nr:Stp1/IreP family PP2C-type Ser/Thr phosphatase [Thermococcus barophilus]ALM75538.1 Protein serine/threonine phosphatase (modular protein) [Thermococcus barophilus]